MAFENQYEWLARLRMAAKKAITEDDVRDIMKNAVERAKKGDKAAMQFVFSMLREPEQSPAPVPPAQQIKANTVNVYPGGRKKKPGKLLIDHRNGNGVSE